MAIGGKEALKIALGFATFGAGVSACGARTASPIPEEPTRRPTAQATAEVTNTLTKELITPTPTVKGVPVVPITATIPITPEKTAEPIKLALEIQEDSRYPEMTLALREFGGVEGKAYPLGSRLAIIEPKRPDLWGINGQIVVVRTGDNKAINATEISFFSDPNGSFKVDQKLYSAGKNGDSETMVMRVTRTYKNVREQKLAEAINDRKVEIQTMRKENGSNDHPLVVYTVADNRILGVLDVFSGKMFTPGDANFPLAQAETVQVASLESDQIKKNGLVETKGNITIVHTPEGDEYYLGVPVPSPTATPAAVEVPKPKAGERLTMGNVNLYTAPDKPLISAKGKQAYFIPGQRIIFTGNISGEYAQVDDGNYKLWINKEDFEGRLCKPENMRNINLNELPEGLRKYLGSGGKTAEIFSLGGSALVFAGKAERLHIIAARVKESYPESDTLRVVVLDWKIWNKQKNEWDVLYQGGDEVDVPYCGSVMGGLDQRSGQSEWIRNVSKMSFKPNMFVYVYVDADTGKVTGVYWLEPLKSKNNSGIKVTNTIFPTKPADRDKEKSVYGQRLIARAKQYEQARMKRA